MNNKQIVLLYRTLSIIFATIATLALVKLIYSFITYLNK